MTESAAPQLLSSRSTAVSRNGMLVQVQCPVCQQRMFHTTSGSDLLCDACGFRIAEIDGIFRALQPRRAAHFNQFIREYEAVRAGEGRGSSSAEFYLSLPYKDLTGRNSWQWEIRAQTFRCFEERILPAIERAHPQGCDVLDIGAGNCWFSYRMALRGHRPTAVDLLDNDTDGLGAAKHFFSRSSILFPRFQAEMDHLPFESSQFDIVIFNASFHYSIDYTVTLGEALRCLRRPGLVVVADSALYQRDENGRAMLAERRAAFQKQFGFSSDSVASLEYLTPARLRHMEATFSIRWNRVTPWYGWKWALRPWRARLLRRREPSRFHLFWAEVLA